jgi:flavin-binding protein dodecin
MSETVYKMLELTGTSTVSMEDAVHTAVARAARTIRHMHWFQVSETRGAIKDGKVSQWQVTIKIGFGLDEPGA